MALSLYQKFIIACAGQPSPTSSRKDVAFLNFSGVGDCAQAKFIMSSSVV